MILTACSQKHGIEYIKQIEYIQTPQELMITPCIAQRHGDGSVADLAKAYIKNLACIKKYENTLDSIRDYNKEVEIIINKNRSGHD